MSYIDYIALKRDLQRTLHALHRDVEETEHIVKELLEQLHHVQTREALKQQLKNTLQRFHELDRWTNKVVRTLLQTLQHHIRSLSPPLKGRITVDLFGTSFIDEHLLDDVINNVMPHIQSSHIDIVMHTGEELPLKRGCLAIVITPTLLHMVDKIMQLDRLLKTLDDAYGAKNVIYIGLTQGPMDQKIFEQAYAYLDREQKYLLHSAVKEGFTYNNREEMKRLREHVERRCHPSLK
jgi:hypothetical protein